MRRGWSTPRSRCTSGQITPVMRAIRLSNDLISTARCTAAVGSGFAGPPCMPQPAEPGSDEGSAAGVALPGHDALNERTCRRAAVAYGLLMKQKQYSSRPPEPSPGGRRCSLSTMWL